MAAKKEPYLDLYTGDWLKDQAVSRCSPATRGVWMDLLCAMHDDSRSGKLSGTADQLARLGRCSTAELALVLTDLQTTGAADVTERNGVVTVINRRMYRKAQDRENNRLRQERYRSGMSDVTQSITPSSRGSPIDSDDDIETLFFRDSLPEILDFESFRKRIAEWLKYKQERRESYKEQGLAAMISRAANLASKYGLSAVEDAMERAMGNRWAGWDQPNSFQAKQEKPKRGGVTLLE